MPHKCFWGVFLVPFCRTKHQSRLSAPFQKHHVFDISGNGSFHDSWAVRGSCNSFLLTGSSFLTGILVAFFNKKMFVEVRTSQTATSSTMTTFTITSETITRPLRSWEVDGNGFRIQNITTKSWFVWWILWCFQYLEVEIEVDHTYWDVFGSGWSLGMKRLEGS